MPATGDSAPVCDLTAIAPAERQAHTALARHLLEVDAQERQELPNGYVFRFAAQRLDDVARFVANERLCCPFWTFVIEVAPAGGPIVLQITGPDGAKELLDG